MSEVMKPAGSWGWVTIGAKNPKNAEALKAAGIETVKSDSKKKVQKAKEELNKRGIKPTLPKGD